MSISSLLFPVLIIFLMVAANALYVAAEFATVGSRRSRVQEAAEAGNVWATKLLAILRDPKKLDSYVAGCQVGITVSSLVAGAYGQAQLTPLLTPFLGAVGGATTAIIIVLLAVTVLQVVLGELLPKTVALRYPERLAMATLVPMQVSLFVFKPLIWLFNGTAFTLMRLLKLNVEHSHTHVHSPEELEALYRDSAAAGLIDAEERDMLSGALGVDERTVGEIMTPRGRMQTVSAGDTVEKALNAIAHASFSRFPVCGVNEDDIVGTVHVRALFAAVRQNPKATVATAMKPVIVVAELMRVPALWQHLREKGQRGAIVINEYGSVSGLVTLEDALEEIFGELQDEFDNEDEAVIKNGDDLSVRGDLSLASLSDRHQIDLPTEHADTIGGLVWHTLGRLPQPSDTCEFVEAALRLHVESMRGSVVERVQISPMSKGESV
jgi:CBS domain containing-hemolysin-like protein